MKEKQIVFADHIGRIVAGVVVEETEAILKVKNPVIVHVEPSQQGQLSVHTIPYIFAEIISTESRENIVWTFNKTSIVISDVNLEERLAEAVNNINKPKSQIVTPNTGDSKIVNLFDNE